MKSRNKILVQVVIWLFVWLLFAFGIEADSRPTSFYWANTVKVLQFVVFFNVVFYYVIPLYLKGKRTSFVVITVVVFIAFILTAFKINEFIFQLQGPMDLNNFFKPPLQADGKFSLPNFPMKRPFIMMIIPPFFVGLFIFGAASAIKAFAVAESNKQAIEIANRKRIEAEMAFFKSQINPHFLLNTLNNLYVISLTDAQKTPDALLKLAEMMKYILHECVKPR